MSGWESLESLEELGVLVFETMPLIHYLQQLKTFQARALKFTTNMCVCVCVPKYWYTVLGFLEQWHWSSICMCWVLRNDGMGYTYQTLPMEWFQNESVQIHHLIRCKQHIKFDALLLAFQIIQLLLPFFFLVSCLLDFLWKEKFIVTQNGSRLRRPNIHDLQQNI